MLLSLAAQASRPEPRPDRGPGPATERGLGCDVGPRHLAGWAPAGGPGRRLTGPRATDARSGVVVVADARIDDRAAASDGVAAGESAASLVLAAYLRWGEDAAERLVGDFAFLVWDPRRRRLLGARDPSGVRSLYFREHRGRFLAASDFGPLARAGTVSLDGFAVADFLSLDARPSERTVLAEVRKLPPGHLLLHDRSGTRIRRWWRPPVRPSKDASDPDGWAERFRAAVGRAVEDRLAGSPGPAAVLLSGGLDSSTVTAVAAERLRETGSARELVAYSQVFPTWTALDESRHARRVAEALAVERHEISAERELVPLDADPALGELEPWAALYEATGGAALDLARERGCSLVATGFGGDCLFDATRFRYWDDVRAGKLWRLAPWARERRSRGGSWPGIARSLLVKPLLPAGVRHRLDAHRSSPVLRHAPAWLGAGLARRTRAEGRLRRRARVPGAGGTIAASRYRQVVDLGLQLWSIESWSALAARRGLRMAHPLLDRRVLELVLESPVELGSRPGPAGSKWLLRHAMRGRLPAPILERDDKGTWGPYLVDRLRAHRRRIEARVERGALEELGLVDPREYGRALATLSEGSGRRSGPLYFLPPLLLDLWIESSRCDVAGVLYPETLTSGG